jgi:hypothetical protein
MIKNITPGPGIYIAANNYSTPYVDMSRHSAGMVRYNGSNFETYNGTDWVQFSSSIPQIELDGVTQEAVQWVRRKMEQEKRLTELAKKHPAVADAMAVVSHAQEQLDIVTALVNVK